MDPLFGSEPLGYEPRRPLPDERRGHPVVAVLIGLATVAATAYLALDAALTYDPPSFACTFCHPNHAGGVALAVVAVLVFVGGMWSAFRVAVGPGRSGRQPKWHHSEGKPTTGRGSTWQVAEPGADLLGSAGGAVVARLTAGTTLVELGYLGDYFQVTTPYGLTGWVAANRLQPPSGAGP
jgi:hypothetical protein